MPYQREVGSRHILPHSYLRRAWAIVRASVYRCGKTKYLLALALVFGAGLFCAQRPRGSEKITI